MNVLAVDDHGVSRHLLRVVLEADGISVLEASDGIEALQVLDRESVDAVISDILMPRMDGYRLCQALRSHAATALLPVIIYTGTFGSVEDEKRAREVGADDFFRKPGPVKLLIESLRLLCREGRLTPAVAVPAAPVELGRMREYSDRLVRELERRNASLTTATNELRQANHALQRHSDDRDTEVREEFRRSREFASFVAERLHGPVRTIDRSTRRLWREFAADMPPEALLLLAAVEQNAGQLAHLVDEILASRPSAHGLQNARVMAR